MENPDSFGSFIWMIMSYAIPATIFLIVLFGTFFTVSQQSVAIIERFGKFARLAGPGLNLKIPLIESIADHVTLRLAQLEIKAETKTKDNVFVHLAVAVQYRVKAGSEQAAYYQLEDAEAQITAYVLDVVRAQVPAMDLDEVFNHKDQVGQTTKADLQEAMSQYGYEISAVLITDVVPDKNVAEAMNQIQTQTRLKVAAEAQGAAEKVLTIARAEAEAAAKKLQGQGVADQRAAIVEGLKKSVTDMAEATKLDANEVMKTVTLTMYTDMLRDIGSSPNAKVIFLPPSPTGAIEAFRDTMLATKET